jgi:hypothetical protein
MAERKSFMSPDELKHLRRVVLDISQEQLVSELVSPVSGVAIRIETLSRWENGKTKIPLWAAERVREFARLANVYDEEVRRNGIRPD